MPTVKSQQGSSRIHDRYDGSPKKFHSVLRKLYQYVLRKKLYFWRGSVMTMCNCPNKLRLILREPIKYKWILDGLLKKNQVLIAFKVQKKTEPAISIQDICDYFNNQKTKTRSQEQTTKLVQIIYDFREVLPHILRRECFGQQKFDKVLVDYFNEEYENILGENKFTETIDQGSNMEKLLEPYEQRVLLREKNDNNDYISNHTKQEIQQIEEQEKHLWYQFKSYRKNQEFNQYQRDSKHQLTQLEKINFMRKFRFHLEDYLLNFKQGHQFQKKDKKKFLPVNITTEILKRQQEERIAMLRMDEQENEDVSFSQCYEQEKEAKQKVMMKRAKHIKKEKGKKEEQKTEHKKISSKPGWFPKPIRNLLKYADENCQEYSSILSVKIPSISDFYRQQNNYDELLCVYSSSNQQYEQNSLFSVNSHKKIKRDEATPNGRSQNQSTGNRNVRRSQCMDLPGDGQAELYY